MYYKDLNIECRWIPKYRLDDNKAPFLLFFLPVFYIQSLYSWKILQDRETERKRRRQERKKKRKKEKKKERKKDSWEKGKGKGKSSGKWKVSKFSLSPGLMVFLYAGLVRVVCSKYPGELGAVGLYFTTWTYKSRSSYFFCLIAQIYVPIRQPLFLLFFPDPHTEGRTFYAFFLVQPLLLLQIGFRKTCIGWK